MLTIDEFAVCLDALGQTDTFKRLHAQNILVEQGSAAVEPMIDLLRNGTVKQAVSAITVLTTIGDRRAVGPLIELLQVPQSLLRMSAAKALAAFNEQCVVDALMSQLNDSNEMVQIWVINSLGVLGDRCAVKPLISLLKTHKSSDVRYMIIRALGDLGDNGVVPHILPMLDDANRHVQHDARHALVKLGYLDATEDIE